MSYSTRASNQFAAHKPNRKASANHIFGAASIACLVAACGWTVYANIFAASVYPRLGSVDYDAPVARRPQARVAESFIAERSRPAPVIFAPATVATGRAPSFDERFAAAAPQGVSPSPQPASPKLAEAPKPKEIKPVPVQTAVVASAQVPPSAQTQPARTAIASVRDMAQRAKAAVMSIASNEKQTIVEKLWGKPQSQPRGSLLAFASADASVTGSLGPAHNIAQDGTTPRYERDTAVYDISAHTVYLPDGTKLEAHSGLGSKLDDPSSASIRMRGVTPPHLYDLTPREALFHGVPALRLNPVGGEETIYGRAGLLAHTFMLGPNGDSNGCVSFRDYNAFLNAYRNQGIKRLAVVARVE